MICLLRWTQWNHLGLRFGGHRIERLGALPVRGGIPEGGMEADDDCKM
jgi:hypothetical protein